MKTKLSSRLLIAGMAAFGDKYVELFEKVETNPDLLNEPDVKEILHKENYPEAILSAVATMIEENNKYIIKLIRHPEVAQHPSFDEFLE